MQLVLPYYVLVTSGYLVVTTGYFSLLLVPRFSNDTATVLKKRL